MLNVYHDKSKSAAVRQRARAKVRAAEASVLEPVFIAVGALSLSVALFLSAQAF